MTETLGWQGDEWDPRIWTRTEFEDMVYSSYKPMRQAESPARRAAKL